MPYTDKKYYDRQCIMVVNDDRGLRNSDIDVFTRFNLPEDIAFSDGRATLNTIYVAHPANKGLYIPLANHELALFRDKMDELILLLQALGATEVEIIREQGMSAEQVNRSSSSTDAGSGWKSTVSLSGGYHTSQSHTSANAKADGYHIKVKSNNDNYPFVPQGLQWYQLTPEWEKMVKQRMLGLQEYELELRSSYLSSISSSQMNALKATAKIIFARLNFSTSSEYESNFKGSGEIVWRLKIKFRPLQKYAQNEIESLSRSRDNQIPNTSTAPSSYFSKHGKSNYRESCKQLIPPNGKISDTIRIELNRLRDKFGISADEAASIEKEYLPPKKWFWPF